jgi:hypothetical protein
MKLTEVRRRALQTLSECHGKSGAFYRGLGVRANTLHFLEREGFAESFGHWRSSSRQWRITPAGRLALSESADAGGRS